MQLVNRFIDVIIDPAITLLTVLAILYFLFGVMVFVNSARTGSEKMGDGKKHMLWGIIGLFVIFSTSGIIGLIQGTLGETSRGSNTIPLQVAP